MLVAIDVEQRDANQDPGAGNAHRDPREGVAGLGAERALAAHAAQRAGQTTAPPALNQHEDDQKD